MLKIFPRGILLVSLTVCQMLKKCPTRYSGGVPRCVPKGTLPVSQTFCLMLKIVPRGILAVSQIVCPMLKIVPKGTLVVSQTVCRMLKIVWCPNCLWCPTRSAECSRLSRQVLWRCPGRSAECLRCVPRGTLAVSQTVCRVPDGLPNASDCPERCPAGVPDGLPNA